MGGNWVLMVAVVLLVPLSAGAQDAVDGPSGAQTPCEWLLDIRTTGLAIREQAKLAKQHRDLFTRSDIKCLKRAGVHKSVWTAARGPTAAAQFVDTVGAVSVALVEADQQRRAEEQAAEQRKKDEAAAARKQRELARQADIASRVDIDLIGVVIGPANQRGQFWDGPAKPVPPHVTKGLADLVVGLAPLVIDAAGGGGMGEAISNVVPQDEAAKLLEFLLKQAIGHYRPPDVYGYAYLAARNHPSLHSTKVSLRSKQNLVNDHFDVSFPNSPGFIGVKMEPGDRIAIQLYDSDVNDDDNIGTVDLTYEHVQTALQAKQRVSIITSDQSKECILYVTIAVRKASSASAQARGRTF